MFSFEDVRNYMKVEVLDLQFPISGKVGGKVRVEGVNKWRIRAMAGVGP